MLESLDILLTFLETYWKATFSQNSTSVLGSFEGHIYRILGTVFESKQLIKKFQLSSSQYTGPAERIWT